MTMLLARGLGACLALFAAASAIQAQAQTIYFGAEGGWSSLSTQTDRITASPSARARFDQGFAAGARVGYEMGPWRFEEEYAYRSNDLSRLTVGGVNVAGAKGSRQSHAAMSNLIYDINLGWPVTPHVGAGLGAVDVIDHSRSNAGLLTRDHDWQLGYQAIAGVRYNATPNMAIELDYRYLATTEATMRTPGKPVRIYKTGYDTHNIMASLVYRFGQAPPPAPPPVIAPTAQPAPAPVASRRVFMVFFDWDKATVTPQGMTIVQQAASAYRSGGRVQIQVTGYTDRSGSPGYNQRLSERRANAVASALNRLGVPRTDMAVSGRGENDNRVPTAAGVREPQNRRVEVVFP